MSYNTLEKKVRYVLDNHDPTPVSDRQVISAVWRTFYPHLIGALGQVLISDILELPSLQQVQAARRRITPKAKEPEGEAWHQQCP